MSIAAVAVSRGTSRGYCTVPIPRALGRTTYRFHGPPAEPGNSGVSVFVHSGGLSLLMRSVSSSFAAAAMAARCASVGSGKGKVSKPVVGIGQLRFPYPLRVRSRRWLFLVESYFGSYVPWSLSILHFGNAFFNSSNFAAANAAIGAEDVFIGKPPRPVGAVRDVNRGPAGVRSWQPTSDARGSSVGDSSSTPRRSHGRPGSTLRLR